jgi:hypothetical protein
VVVTLAGTLTKGALQASLTELDKQLAGRRGLLVDAREMGSYETEARDLFVQWNREHRADLTGVAVVTEKVVWHMVVAAMGFAIGQKLRAFAQWDEAEKWLRSLPG